jgi:hypothetical protein
MTPAQLRVKCRVELSTMATRLHLTAIDVRALEATPAKLWECGMLAEYAAALGHRLILTVMREPDGRSEEIEL